MYHVYFMCDVQDLASNIPTSLYDSLMEMREKYEEFERNIEVQKQILQDDHLEEWPHAPYSLLSTFAILQSDCQQYS